MFMLHSYIRLGWFSVIFKHRDLLIALFDLCLSGSVEMFLSPLKYWIKFASMMVSF